MDILSKLGIDGRLLIAQIINFGILFFFLKKFLYRPILAMLEKRTQTIEKSLADAKAIEERLAAAQATHDKIIADARKEASRLLEAMNVQIEERRVVAVEKVKEEVHSVIKTAKENIEADRASMMQDAKKEFAGLVLLATEKVLVQAADRKVNAAFVEKALAKIEV